MPAVENSGNGPAGLAHSLVEETDNTDNETSAETKSHGQAAETVDEPARAEEDDGAQTTQAQSARVDKGNNEEAQGRQGTDSKKKSTQDVETAQKSEVTHGNVDNGTQVKEEEKSQGDWWGWGGLVSSLRAKTETVVHSVAGDLGELVDTMQKNLGNLVEMTKNDLDEFVSTVETETMSVVSRAATAVTGDGGGAGMQGWLGARTAANSTASGDSAGTASSLNGQVPPVTYTRKQIFLQTLQSDPSTYCTEPEDLDDFDQWEKSFDLATKESEIAELLAANKELKAAQGNLVPKIVSYEIFWSRYFYKVYLYDVEEEKRESLRKKVLESADDVFGWDEEEEEDNTKSSLDIESASKKGLDASPGQSHESELDKLSVKNDDGAQPSDSHGRSSSDSEKLKCTSAAPAPPQSLEAEKTPSTGSGSESWEIWE